MAISNQAAAQTAILVFYAEMMYVEGSTVPKHDPRIAAAGWDVIAYLIARDSILPEKSRLQMGDTVFYGYLAQNQKDNTAYLAAVRGTDGQAEWIIDAEFLQIDYPKQPGAKVEQGFWGVYDSMTLVDPNGAPVAGKAAEAIANMIGKDGKVTIAGHSLGSSLATYLSLETAQIVGERASAALFASPHTGNGVFVELYDRTLGDRYSLYNYALDIVPYVPFSLPEQDIDYEPLPKATIIDPMSSQADVQVGIDCDHHLTSYTAMLDYEIFLAAKKTANEDELALFACVLGPREVSLNEARAEILALTLKYLAGEKLVRALATRLRQKQH
jgi:hypothetical protein